MKFALFYEIPVPRPWTPGKEHQAYKNTIEQACSATAWASTRSGPSSTTSSTSTRTARTPRCSTARSRRVTENIRIGYGVRLLPKPYNHPIRTAESVAVLDLISDGRVDFGTGRSSTRAELEGFGIDPDETREHVARGARPHRRRLDDGRVPGRRASTGAWARRAACTRSRCSSRTRRSSARRRASSGHEEMGKRGIGLCSFTVGLPPEQLAEQHRDVPQGPRRVHEAGGQVPQRHRGDVHDGALRADRPRRRTEVAKESFEWYPKHGGELIASVAEWHGGARPHRARHLPVHRRHAAAQAGRPPRPPHDRLPPRLRRAVMGDPDACIAAASGTRRSAATCSCACVNPYNIPHERSCSRSSSWASTCSPSSRNAARPPSVPRT